MCMCVYVCVRVCVRACVWRLCYQYVATQFDKVCKCAHKHIAALELRR